MVISFQYLKIKNYTVKMANKANSADAKSRAADLQRTPRLNIGYAHVNKIDLCLFTKISTGYIVWVLQATITFS